MDFSLSSSLVGNAVLSADNLALDLQFALDKTLTARKGPTPVFTRGSTGRFVGSNGLIQSAAINAPRFDHDPVTGVCKGLLMEEARTNNASQSGAMNLWGGAGGSKRSVSSVLSPDGAVFATLGSSGGPSFGGIVARSLTTLASVVGTQYTASCFVKKDNYRYVSIDYGPIRPSGTALPFFDLDTLVFNANGSATTATVVSYPNGWYRLSISGAALAANSSTLDVNLVASNGQGGGVIGTGNNILIWGAQLETGAFVTSYIPTGTTTLTRSADVCSITGSDFSGFYNQPEGTFVTSSSRTSTNSNAFIGHYSDNSFNNGFDVRYPSFTQVSALMNVANSNQVPAMVVNITSGSTVKQAFSYKLNDCGYSVNGAATITDTSALIPTATRMVIGNAAVPSQTLYLNGTISSMRYFKKRLANAKLQTLTV